MERAWTEHPSLSLAYLKCLGQKPNGKGLDVWDGFPVIDSRAGRGAMETQSYPILA